MNVITANAFSIIIPTFEEAQNIPDIVQRISEVSFDSLYEIIIVDDDSQDGTRELVNGLLSKYPFLRFIIRKDKKSLSQSVIEGINQSNYPLCVVMDADLSHPPEKIPAMLKEIAKPTVDFVIGSRYIAGGSSDESWPLTRKICSRLAALFARMVLPVSIKDPLSGFLVFKKKDFFAIPHLEAIGWKIGLEMMVKGQFKNIKEIPIHFSEREYGASKLNLRVALTYVKHIRRLLWYKLMA
jgi:dolichol-phosphate mannosyltransferase